MATRGRPPQRQGLNKWEQLGGRSKAAMKWNDMLKAASATKSASQEQLNSFIFGDADSSSTTLNSSTAAPTKSEEQPSCRSSFKQDHSADEASRERPPLALPKPSAAALAWVGRVVVTVKDKGLHASSEPEDGIGSGSGRQAPAAVPHPMPSSEKSDESAHHDASTLRDDAIFQGEFEPSVIVVPDRAIAAPAQAIAAPAQAVAAPAEAIAACVEAVAAPAETVASPAEAVAASAEVSLDLEPLAQLSRRMVEGINRMSAAIVQTGETHDQAIEEEAPSDIEAAEAQSAAEAHVVALPASVAAERIEAADVVMVAQTDMSACLQIEGSSDSVSGYRKSSCNPSRCVDAEAAVSAAGRVFDC